MDTNFVIENLKDVILTVMTIGNVVSNITVILGIVTCEEVWNNDISPLLLSVFISDLLAGLLTGISSYLSWTNTVDPGPALGRFHSFLGIFVATTSLMSMSNLAVVKAITIVKPLRANTLITRKRVYIFCALVWIVSIVACIPFALLHGYKYYKEARITWTGQEGVVYFPFVSSAILFPLLTILTIANTVIIAVVVRQVMKIRRVQVQPANVPTPTNPVLQAFKSTRGLVAVCVMANVTLLPVPFNREPGFWFFWFVCSGTLLNGILYIAFSPKVKNSLKMKICRGCRASQNTIGTSNNNVQAGHGVGQT